MPDHAVTDCPDRGAKRVRIGTMALLAVVTTTGCFEPGEIGAGPSRALLQGTDGTPLGAEGPAGVVNLGGGGGVGPDGLVAASTSSACDTRGVPDQPLRRLSSTQWDNTLRDLFGAPLAGRLLSGSAFPKTVVDTGFVNDAEANTVNTAESNAIEDEAARIADLIVAGPAPFVTGLMPCGLSAGYGDAEVDACLGAFLDDFGRRAYRRPLSSAERAIVQSLYDTVRADQSADEAFAAVLQFFVQSPALLYRTEKGMAEVADGMLALGDYEMASRLSYFLLDSMPDAELFAAAEAGELSTPAQIEAQARRLMEGASFGSVVSGFLRDWLHLYELEHSGKDATMFPDYTTEVQQSLQEEASRLVEYVLEQGTGSVSELFETDVFMVNSVLANWYGVDAPGAGPDTWVPVQVPQRSGLLTTSAFMSSLAESNRTNAIHRGAFMQREVLCKVLPALPGNIDIMGPLQSTALLPTARERLSPLESGTCSGCHKLMNPTGLAFENYDASGQWRDTENGSVIDPAGEMQLDGQAVTFDGPMDITTELANSEEVADCFALQWYRASLGRKEFAEDSCSVATLQEKMLDSGGDIRELIVALTQTDGFLYRSVIEEGN